MSGREMPRLSNAENFYALSQETDLAENASRAKSVKKLQIVNPQPAINNPQ
jgi:hypothetical protein